MNSKKSILASLAPVTFVLGAAVTGSFAHAEGGSPASGGVLTIKGQIAAQSCTISGDGQGENFTVRLPDTPVKSLAQAGSVAGTTPFEIALTGCTPNSGKVHTFWQQGTNVLPNGTLKNIGTANNVEVRLRDKNGFFDGPIDLNKPDGAQNSQSVSIDNGSAHLKYAAEYISAEGKAEPGAVVTSVAYTMIYD